MTVELKGKIKIFVDIKRLLFYLDCAMNELGKWHEQALADSTPSNYKQTDN